MKKILIPIVMLFFLGNIFAQEMMHTLAKDERKSAIKYIKWTSKEMKKTLKGLSPAQLNFHEAADKWSIQDCLYHIAFSEGALRGALDGAVAAPADPAAKAELKATDEQIKNGVTDRTNKVKTAPPFEPQNTGFKSYDEAKTAFKTKRAALIELIKTTQVDLRNHIVSLPFGNMDAYQMALFIAGHSNRHTKQMQEVKMASAYPKS
ncbi:MAG: DinB family protein [Saprospiraceae bacterium]